MKCHRCSGLVITQVVEWPNITETRCVNCGWMLNPIYQEPMRERHQRKDTCTNCKEKVEAGFTQCSRCRKYQAGYRKTHPRKKGKVSI